MKGRFARTITALFMCLALIGMPSSTGDSTDRGSGPSGQMTVSLWSMTGGAYSHNRTTDMVYDEGLGAELEWSVNVCDYRTPEFVVSPNGTVFLADYSTGLVAVGPEGNVLWRFDPPDVAYVTCPALGTDGTIYFTAQTDHLFAIHPNGTERWNLSVDSGVASSTTPVVMHDGTVFLGVGGYKLFCIGPNGTVNWSLNVKGCIYTPPAMDGNGRLIFNTAGGKIYCVTREGKVVWERSMGVYSHATTSLTSDGEAIVRLDNGSLLCLRPNGTTKWHLDLDIGDLEDRIAISDIGDIYLITNDYVGGGERNRALLGLHPNGTLFMREMLTDYWGSPLVMGDGRLMLPGIGVKIHGNGMHPLWPSPGEDRGPMIKFIAPVNERELRALSIDGDLISLRMRSVPRPSNLTANQVDDHIHLEWARPRMADDVVLEYTVIRETIGEGEILEIGWTEMTEFDDLSLELGKSFLYYIQAVIGNETSAFSNNVLVTHRDYVRSIHVQDIFIDCHYQEDMGAIIVEFKEYTYPGVLYMEDRVESVDVLRGSYVNELEVIMVMYPTELSDKNPQRGTISYLSGGSGVFYDKDLKPGKAYHYIVVYHYESGITLESGEEWVYLPDVDGPKGPGNFFKVCWEAMVIAFLFNVVVIVALVAFVIRKFRTIERK